MKPIRRLVAHPIVVLTFLSLGAIRPIVRGGLPHADDLGNHLLRLAQVEHLFRQGVLFSRWSPDLAHGYGYPLLNFMAPMAYYLALPFRLIGFSVPNAIQLTFALGLILSGWTMYRLAREKFGGAAALVAAAGLIYSPYYAYDVLFRGNFGESMAIMWMPLALWAMGRSARGAGGRWVAIAALSYAAVNLTHNVSALLFSPVLAFYGVWEAFNQEDRPLTSRMSPVFAALGLGLGLSAFFWLPALVEKEDIALDVLTTSVTYIFRNNFQPLREILAWPTVVYRDLLNPSPPPTLGLVPILLGLLSWTRFRRQSRTAKRQIIFWSAMLAGYFFLLLPASTPLWELLPLIEFIQFPWRLFCVALLFPALLAASFIQSLPRERQSVAAVILVAALVVADQTWLYPPYGPKPEKITVADITPYEVATNTLGATALGEYLPHTVSEVPEGPPAVLFEAEQGEVISAMRNGLRLEGTIRAPGATTVTANGFAFAGWQAQVNGASAPITPSKPHGLITFPVPPGTSTIILTFRETPLRLGADIISVASLLIILSLTITRRPSKGQASPNGNRRLALGPGISVIGLGIAAAWLLPAIRPARLSDGSLNNVANPQQIPFNDGMVLLGSTSLAKPLPASEQAEITLYWTTDATPRRNYWTTVALQDASGLLWSPKKSVAPTRFRRPIPTTAWPPGTYAADRHLVNPLPGTPPGDYDLVVTLFDRETLTPVPQRGTALTLIPIGKLSVERPAEPPVFSPQETIDPQFDSPLQLLGYDIDRAQARPGDPVLITLYWRAAEPLRREPIVQLGLDGPLLEKSIAGEWIGGERRRSQHPVRLPARTPSGTYTWTASWCIAGNCGPLVRLGSLTVEAPARTYTLPPIERRVDIPVGPTASLVGVDITATSAQAAITLTWQADAETDTSYRVFVHIIDENGEIVAQSDGEPAGWTRPTTGWLPGEIIRDQHTISLPADPPGDLRLTAGLYEAETGLRPGPPVELRSLTIP